MIRIEDDVRSVLTACECNGDAVSLPSGQLSRALYVKVNKVLEALGGKWNRKAKAHLFGHDITAMWDEALSTGRVVDMKRDYGYFATPERVARRLVSIAGDFASDMNVLEPSAGEGAIVAVIPTGILTLVELNQARATTLMQRFPSANVLLSDFLELSPALKHDRIVMNPPFNDRKDAEHVRHAFSMLNSGGVLVSIVSGGWKFREDRKAREFREFVEIHGEFVEDLDSGTFAESGTMIKSCIIRLTH